MSTSNPDDRRRFTRVDFNAEASLRQGEHCIDVRLVDVSLNGVLVETPAEYRLQAKLPAILRIQLADDVCIEMQVHLAHSSHNILGFQCDSIDMESVSHLRRLIELNIGERDASERVLDELLLPH